jgi:hypothetical protein
LDTNADSLLILFTGKQQYYSILRDAFPKHRYSRLFPDKTGKYQWGTYINNADVSDRQKISQLLTLLTTVVYLNDELSQTFALDYHSQPTENGFDKTVMGNSVYLAKYSNNKAKAEYLASQMINFIGSHPSYMVADLVIAVPSSKANKPFDLTNYLVQRIAETCGLMIGTSLITKIRQTSPMKDFKTPKEKFDNIQGAFRVVKPEAVENKTVILVDDIYHTGATLHELGTELQQAGAKVLGLVATKTIRNPR